MTEAQAHPAPSNGGFSHQVAIADLGKKEFEVALDAGAAERLALARRFGLVAVDTLEAEARLKRVGDGGVRVRARFTAEVTQTCVVTLAPVAARVEGTADVLFMPAETGDRPEVTVSTLADDAPEPLLGDVIDVGELVAEHFGLALDPYPRRPGAVFAGAESDAGNHETALPEVQASPFAVLRKLKSKP